MYLQYILKRSFLISDFNLFPTFWFKNLYLQLNHPVGVLKEFTRGRTYWAKIMAEVKTWKGTQTFNEELWEPRDP